MREDIYHHGNLLGFAKSVARRWGWDARAENVGVDPFDSSVSVFGTPKSTPRRGDLVIFKPGGAQVGFAYELPESPDIIERTIREVIQADRIETDRRANPDEFKRPIEVKGA